MQCPICGVGSSVLDTRDAANLTTRRRRVCDRGHKFVTVEIHAPVFCSAKRRAAAFALTVRQRVAIRQRDKIIAYSLAHGETWQRLAVTHNLTKTAVYLAARRGRHAQS